MLTNLSDQLLSDITGRTPKVSDITGRTPKVSDITGRTPKVSDITGRTPKVSDITGRITKVSIYPYLMSFILVISIETYIYSFTFRLKHSKPDFNTIMKGVGLL